MLKNAKSTRLKCSLMKVVLFVAVLTFGQFSGVEMANAGDDEGMMGESFYKGLSCGELWHERNAIFARHGHCFTTERGIRAFGTACKPPFGKLPPHAKEVVDEIKSWEASKGC